MNIYMHHVAKIEISKRFQTNSNSRTLRITDVSGAKLEISLYGNTDALDALPLADDFRDHDAGAKALFKSEAA